jgi:hypothetical protein
MTDTRKTRTLLIAGCLFAAGWIGGTSIQPSLVGRAVAQQPQSSTDQNVLALMLGVASVAVDTEAAAGRINELTDRLAALERRVQQLEKPAGR